MASPIPEYYRHLAEQRRQEPVEEHAETSAGARAETAPSRRPAPRVQKSRAPVVEDELAREPPLVPYRAHRFAMQLYEEWQDKTLFVLTGPVSDGLQHNVVVMAEPDVEVRSIDEFAELQVQTLESSLKGCRILLREPTTLASGRDAVRVIYSWWPAEDVRFYQEQIYVLHDSTAYKLTATFTKKTRKTLGPQVERIMRSFEPMPPPQP